MFESVTSGACWWCGQPADSREHRHKRADLAREFGPGPYLGKDAVVRGRESVLRDIQGPKSDLAKFHKTICSRCNNERSQPLDLAYDRLTSFLRERERRVLGSRSFDLRDIYGPAWADQRHNVLRYYAKHAACRLADNDLAVPVQVRAYLDDGERPDCMKFDCEIREDIATMVRGLGEQRIGDGSLWIGDLWTMQSRSSGEISSAESFLGYRWFRMYWAIGEDVAGFEEPFADPVVSMRVGYSIDPDEIRARVDRG